MPRYSSFIACSRCAAVIDRTRLQVDPVNDLNLACRAMQEEVWVASPEPAVGVFRQPEPVKGAATADSA